MNTLSTFSFCFKTGAVPCRRLLSAVLVGAVVVGLAACSNKDGKVGQSLARVDGQEITVLQLNEELQHANVNFNDQETAKKRILESLIDRQLVLAEAMRNKIDRTSDVVQAIERSKAQIIAQAYMQGVTAKIAKPGKTEIDDYYNTHPQFFANRKLFDMMHVVLASKDFGDEFKSALGSAKSMNEVVAWMENHDVKYKRGRLLRTTADLPQEMSAKLLNLPKEQLFIVNEGENTMLVSLLSVKDSAVSAQNAAPQIEQYLLNKKAREMAETEIAHLRSLAKVEYLNSSAPVTAMENKPSPQQLSATEAKPPVGL